MAALVFEIKRILKRHRLIDQGETVIVGVSGGPDSMALLHILSFLHSHVPCTPVAVYVDHGLRPHETPAEIELVRSVAATLDLACEVIPVATRSLAESEKLSLEHAARELRYQALRGCASQYGAGRIAVAHTADDQAEELLLRLLRGSGRKGLAGMQLQENEVIRPLLQTSKRQILAYLHEHDISYCLDSSNEDQRFLRNRIRHTLLPLLENEFDPGIRKALLKTASNLREDEDYLEAETKRVWPQVFDKENTEHGNPVYVLVRAVFNMLHPCLQRRLVERLLWQLGSQAQYTHILAVLQAAATGRTGSELHLSQGLRVEIARETLEFSFPRGKKAWRGRLLD